MADGSDAIADWPLLNALVNTAAGATWVSIHHGGGVGIGYSQHAGMVVVADGTELAARKLERVLTTDPGMGVVRHVDAGYERAIEVARERGVRIPMLDRSLSLAADRSTSVSPPPRRPRPDPRPGSSGAIRTGEKRTRQERGQAEDRADPDRRRGRRSSSDSPAPISEPIGIVPQTRNRIVAFIRPRKRSGRDRLAEAHLVHVVDDVAEARGRTRRRGTRTPVRPAAPAGPAAARTRRSSIEPDDRRARRRSRVATRLEIERAEEDADAADAADRADGLRASARGSGTT